jgi:hypothetical protein
MLGNHKLIGRVHTKLPKEFLSAQVGIWLPFLGASYSYGKAKADRRVLCFN